MVHRLENHNDLLILNKKCDIYKNSIVLQTIFTNKEHVMETLTRYQDLPVVTAANCFDIVQELGIKAWKRNSEKVDVEQWLNGGSLERHQDYSRFAPKVYATGYTNPYTKQNFNAFSVEIRPYSMVFALLDETYVVITAEWKHGNDKITLIPVCSVLGKEEGHLPTIHEKMRAAGIRGVMEGTGFTVTDLTPLSSSHGTFHSVRNTNSCCYPFYGKISSAAGRSSTWHHNESEHLAVVLFKPEEWVKLVGDSSLFEKNLDFGLEDSALSVTLAALLHTGNLRFHF
jgi:hypothetical protein